MLPAIGLADHLINDDDITADTIASLQPLSIHSRETGAPEPDLHRHHTIRLARRYTI